ncbi:phosphate transport system regulatory protein PhoU [Alsobacter metallidurans]|uniref:Phosphate-specific transport system accessory protein PhoU n=1 Tax=Alsobacter metallidurans TaxID=340221 RepID=A0A917MJF3_9HYPH|nr:phosphate signaling complex protein PhoU [Alsobacter metallidurans]GGH26275.1 phosphate transport system regulatory protein PhoU [Alsobacter metallidurans]
MANHTVAAFDLELKELQRTIAEMGGLAEKMQSDAIDALAKQDIRLAQKIIAADPTLDRLQREVEEKAILTIARRQPMAVDLRDVIATIRIANDLERVGDLVKNIAKRILAMEGQFPPQKLLAGIGNMSLMALNQFKSVIDAYTQRDAQAALAVWQRDGEIDNLYTSLFRELLTYMMEDPRNISFCTHLLFGAKNVERIGDHATNIAETVYYLVTGESLAVDRPRGDENELSVQAGQ